MQISDIYWCSLDGKRGKGCNALCTDFEDSDITDDVACVRKIFNEHQRLFGNGFQAWTTYEPYCKDLTSSYTDDCYATDQNEISPIASSVEISTLTSTSFGTTARPITFLQTTFSLPPPTTQQFTSLPSSTYRFPLVSSSNANLSTSFVKPTQPAKPPTPYTLLTSIQSSPAYAAITSLQPIQTIVPTTPRTKLSTVASTTLGSTKWNIFDLYLNQYATKKPQRYEFPPITSNGKQPITFASPYTVRVPTTQIPNRLNTYHVPAALTSFSQPSFVTTTTKPPGYYQNFFQSQIAKFVNGANVPNVTSTKAVNPSPFQFAPFTRAYQLPSTGLTSTLASIATTPKPRVWHYSFSGITKPSSPPL